MLMLGTRTVTQQFCLSSHTPAIGLLLRVTCKMKSLSPAAEEDSTALTPPLLPTAGGLGPNTCVGCGVSNSSVLAAVTTRVVVQVCVDDQPEHQQGKYRHMIRA
jgi:hypothetical protein